MTVLCDPLYILAIEAVNKSLTEEVIEPHTVVTNAAIPSKRFSQVHYLKICYKTSVNSICGREY